MTSPDAAYTMGYREFVEFEERLTQSASASFLIPQLKPGQHLLDIGCGAGFLSLRLAGAVTPGELHGVDIEPSQVDAARALAADRGCSNAAFQVADALDLPFADGSFDIVHMGGLLLHVADTAQALAEAKRVLKPGGMLACRDLLAHSSFAYPELGVMRRSWEVFTDLIAADGGHPLIAREMKGHLQQAGFADIRVSFAMETHQAPEEVEYFYPHDQEVVSGRRARERRDGLRGPVSGSQVHDRARSGGMAAGTLGRGWDRLRPRRRRPPLAGVEPEDQGNPGEGTGPASRRAIAGPGSLGSGPSPHIPPQSRSPGAGA